MAKATTKVSQQVLQPNSEYTSPEPSLIAAVDPWWQYVDWWEGLTHEQIINKFKSSAAEIRESSWAAIPDILATMALDMIDERFQVYHVSVETIAQNILYELVRTKGYSTEHAKQAWACAIEFERLRTTYENGTYSGG